MPQPRNPKGIKPRVKDARAYDKALRTSYLDPFLNDLRRRRLATAESVNQAYAALRAGLSCVGSVAACGRAFEHDYRVVGTCEPIQPVKNVQHL